MSSKGPTGDLHDNDVKFKEYLRIAREQFTYIADLKCENVTLQATHNSERASTSS